MDLSERAVAVDWNGTVVSDLTRALSATNVALAEGGVQPITEPEFRRRFTVPLELFFHSLGLDPLRAGRATATWNKQVAATDAPLTAGAECFFGAMALRDVRIVVISAADSTSIHADACRHSLSLSDVRAPIRSKASELEQLAAEFTLLAYVGDTQADILAARAAGVPAIGIAAGYHGRARLAQAGATAVIDDLREIASFLFDPV